MALPLIAIVLALAAALPLVFAATGRFPARSLAIATRTA
jgi:hypothetical protein